MAATVVAVVVFLCGVLVGRGVPLTGRATTTAETGVGHEDVAPATLGLPRSEPSAGATVSEELSYGRILTGEQADLAVVPEPDVAEPSVAPQAEPDSATAERRAPSPVRRAEADDGADASAAPGRFATEPAAPSRPDGYYVQVVALRETHAVSGVVDRLLDRGLPALVVNPDADAPISLYRIRVGPYVSRAEAERVRQRIETEDEFAPFITR